MNSMETIQKADLAMMLEARERRYYRQQELLAAYRRPLLSFSMNIAGPIKNTPLIRRGYQRGKEELIERIHAAGGKILFEEEISEATGCEGMYVTDLDGALLKKLACQTEEETPLGRLFDMDVLNTEGEKLERPSPRRCLICGKPAKECARSRTHSVEELQKATTELLVKELDRQDIETVCELAVRALLYEVCVTPKPGLVDRKDNGSHRDMDIYTFMASAASLWPYFETCAQTGLKTADLAAEETLKQLRVPGMKAERRMFHATEGVNTHKGAIFSIGILCAACMRLKTEERFDPEKILSEAGRMTAGITEKELGSLKKEQAVTAGQRIYAEYGIGGIRAEAEAGFPSVLKYGLPILEGALENGRTKDEAGWAALLSIIAHTPDTNMISRGGIETQKAAAQEAETIIEKGIPDESVMEQLNREYIMKNLSPGGSADLLAVCWLMHFLKEAA